MNDRELLQLALEALGSDNNDIQLRVAIVLRNALAVPVSEPVAAIRSLTDQCAALIRERDDFQKQLWRYERNGVTCQTYRHTVERTCAECNVQMCFAALVAAAEREACAKLAGPHLNGEIAAAIRARN